MSRLILFVFKNEGGKGKGREKTFLENLFWKVFTQLLFHSFTHMVIVYYTIFSLSSFE